MRVSLRPADLQDFEYCAKLYFGDRPNPDVADLRRRWDPSEVRIITLDGADIGWLQTRIEGEALFIVQLFIEPPRQGQGLGTQVLERLIEEARTTGRAVTLGVVKTNPARRLYDRLGFEVTHEDERKFYMRRQQSVPSLRLQ